MVPQFGRIDGGRVRAPLVVRERLLAERDDTARAVWLVPDISRRFLAVLTQRQFAALVERIVALPRTDPAFAHYRKIVQMTGVVADVVDINDGSVTVQHGLRAMVGLGVDDDIVWHLHDDVVELWPRTGWLAVRSVGAPVAVTWPVRGVAIGGADTPVDVTLPDFILDADRAVLGPFALWGPVTIGRCQRWSGVNHADPTRLLSVVTAPKESDVLAALEGDGDGEFDARRVATGHPQAPVCLVRRAHPGITLRGLLDRDRHSVPPPELLIAVARAVTRGVRALRRIKGSDDVVVGIDGVITADGFDGPLRTDGYAWTGPQLADAEACRRLLTDVFDRVFFNGAALLRAVDDSANVPPDEERRFVSGLVHGLAPDVVDRVRAEADELALLGDDVWAVWATDDVTWTERTALLDEDTVAGLRNTITNFQREHPRTTETPGEVFGQLVALWERDSSVRIDTFEKAWRHGNARELELTERALRQAGFAIGARRVGSLVRDIERTARNGTTFDPRQVAILRLTSARTTRALRRAFDLDPPR